VGEFAAVRIIADCDRCRSNDMARAARLAGA
jgi:hypothetical protein